MTIEVDYRFPPGVDAQKQAKIIAVGQTAGTSGMLVLPIVKRFCDRILSKVVSRSGGN